MKTIILTGSKQQIAEGVTGIAGDVLEAIVFIDEHDTGKLEIESTDIFAEMAPYTVKAGGADYSRDAIYQPIDGE